MNKKLIDKNDASLELIKAIITWINNAKIENIIEKKCHETYFVGQIIIGTGSSSRHLAGTAENLVAFLKKEYNLLPILDVKVKEWVIILCDSIAVHLMTEQKRDHYKLEQMIESLKKDD